MSLVLLPNQVRAILENGIPCVLGTCSADGIPNASIVSRAYYVGPSSLAVSRQFFNKTARNVRENPRASLLLIDIAAHAFWQLEVEYDRSETEGPVFEDMDTHIETIATATGVSGIFKLKAADVYTVRRVEQL